MAKQMMLEIGDNDGVYSEQTYRQGHFSLRVLDRLTGGEPKLLLTLEATSTGYQLRYDQKRFTPMVVKEAAA